MAKEESTAQFFSESLLPNISERFHFPFLLTFCMSKHIQIYMYIIYIYCIHIFENCAGCAIRKVLG